jgi:hypothetical protein
MRSGRNRASSFSPNFKRFEFAENSELVLVPFGHIDINNITAENLKRALNIFTEATVVIWS